MNFINSPNFRAAVARFQSGSTRKRISKAKLCTIELPLPPSSEQRRIVEAIESYFTRLDDAVATLERVQRNLKRYRASVLKAAVEGRLVPTEAELAHAEGRDYEPASVLLERVLAERRRRWHEAGVRGKYEEPVAPDATELPGLPEGWCWASVGRLLREPLRNGHSARKVVDGDVRTLTLTAVTERDFSEINTKLTAADQQQVQDLWLEHDDIFVERSNTPELVGTAAIYRGQRGFAIFPDLLIRVRPVRDVLPLYVEAVLRSSRARTFFRRAAQGIAGSMPKISQETVAALAVPLPPSMEQARIVAELERQLSVADEAETSVTICQTRCARLRQSILKWAFEGKLADQDPNDEPASALLERILTETAARVAGAPNGASSKPRRRRGTMTGTKLAKQR
ncbi:MAG: restriction endonuclease subunit S [Gammaproteobacteria bacterium]